MSIIYVVIEKISNSLLGVFEDSGNAIDFYEACLNDFPERNFMIVSHDNVATDFDMGCEDLDDDTDDDTDDDNTDDDTDDDTDDMNDGPDGCTKKLSGEEIWRIAANKPHQILTGHLNNFMLHVKGLFSHFYSTLRGSTQKS